MITITYYEPTKGGYSGPYQKKFSSYSDSLEWVTGKDILMVDVDITDEQVGPEDVQVLLGAEEEED